MRSTSNAADRPIAWFILSQKVPDRAEADKFFRQTLEVVDQGGRGLGEHRGSALYTVGQRAGLGQLSEPGPWYVTAVDVARNRLVVGRREDLAVSRVELEDVRFVDGPPPEGGAVPCEARLRYRTRPVPATYRGRVLELAEPFSGAAPGQAAVMYRGSRVLGGGTIRAAA